MIDDRLAEFREKVRTKVFPTNDQVEWTGVELMRAFVISEFDKAVKLMEEERTERMKEGKARFDTMGETLNIGGATS